MLLLTVSLWVSGGGSGLTTCHPSFLHGLARASSSHGNEKSSKEQLEDCFYSYHIGQNKSHGQSRSRDRIAKSHDKQHGYWRDEELKIIMQTILNMRKYLTYCFRNYSCYTYYFKSVLFDNEKGVGSSSYNYVTLRERLGFIEILNVLF